MGRWLLQRRLQRFGTVVGIVSHPVIQVREEAVQQLAHGVSHGEQSDGNFSSVLVAPVAKFLQRRIVLLMLQKIEEVSRDERAQAVRHDHYPVVTASVRSAILRNVPQQRNISLKN